MRVLICDDDLDLGVFLKTLFDVEGWQAEVVTGGEQCLAALQDASNLPDVLVLDHKMPGLLGTQVADQLRRDGFTRPIVLCSGHIGPEYRTEVQRLGLIQVNKIDASAVVRIAGAAAEEAAAERR